MSDISADPVFKGHTPGGMSCEDFVQAVRKHAIAQNKPRDDEWIADFVMSCFTDDSLHWSEDLPGEVQGDWSLLRRALLAEYGSSNRKPSLQPPPAAQPTLVINPVATSQSLRGRVRVVNPYFTGYLSKQLESTREGVLKWLCLGTENASEACILSGTVANGGLQFRFEDLDPLSSHFGTHLGIIWMGTNISLDCNCNAALTVIQIQGSSAGSNVVTAWKGPPSWVTWIRWPDNSLTPKLEGMPEAEITMASLRLVMSSQAEAFDKTNSSWKKVRFVFEPI